MMKKSPDKIENLFWYYAKERISDDDWVMFVMDVKTGYVRERFHKTYHRILGDVYKDE